MRHQPGHRQARAELHERGAGDGQAQSPEHRYHL
jgi:hypothetical protein